MEYLAFTVGGKTVNAPKGLPQGGQETTIINNGLTLFVSAAVIITVLYAVYAGIKWVTSGGDKQKVAAARAQLTWAIIGVVIVLISFFIISIFSFFFGVNLLDFKLD